MGMKVLSIAALVTSLIWSEGAVAHPHKQPTPQPQPQPQLQQPKNVDVTKTMKFKNRADALSYIQSVCATYGQLKSGKSASLQSLASSEIETIEQICMSDSLNIPKGDGTVYAPIHAQNILETLTAACKKGRRLHRTHHNDALEQVCKGADSQKKGKKK